MTDKVDQSRMHVEASDVPVPQQTSKNEESEVLLDKHGFPLVPQPSSSKMDPLNWSFGLKMLVLAQISCISFLSLLAASMITPAFVPLAAFLHKNLVQTAYVTSVFILFTGISPLIWTPIANVYGRRPVYIATLILAVATSAGSGAAKDYPGLLTLRAFNGLGSGAPGGLGSATVCDLFFQHERGLYMGVFTVALINGGHIAPVIGGFIEKNLSWQWCFFVPAIIGGVFLVTLIFFLPETLFPRSEEALAQPPRTWAQNMTMRGKIHPTRKLHWKDFIRPVQMLKYPSVLFPALYYSVSFGYGSILFIISSANVFAQIYKFQPYQTGLLLGIPLTVGTILGEFVSGGFSDWVRYKRARAHGDLGHPEDRLLALLPAFIITPLGIIIEGVCITKKTHWIGPAMGIGIASFGLQICTTVIYAYCAECYKPQMPEIGAVLNFGRNMFSFPIGFYVVPLGEQIGFQDAWILWAMLDVLFFIPMIFLMWRGRKWREALGPVKFHSDL